MRIFILSLTALLFHSFPLTSHANGGFAEGVTGGGGGREVTAATAEQLRAFAGSEEPLTISVNGELRTGTIQIRSNKTIQGRGPKPSIIGTLFVGSGVQNVIIRDLHISNPTKRKKAEGFDGITVRGGKQIWITNCTFRDCSDGAIDMSHGADRITVSWCKFEYSSSKLEHRLVMLIYGPPKKKAKGRAHVTLHHNWFAQKCHSRMPAAKKARVHMYNNFFDCKGNDYATNAREESEILSENNFYQSIRNPFFSEDEGRLRGKGNIFVDCTGKRSKGDDKVFEPQYSFKLDKTSDVPELIRSKAGARL
ncbi:MAG: polysaccharide lyase family 1 protein [Terrimicrobiaceae bacterium]